MIRMKSDELVKEINHVHDYTESILSKYLRSYAEYGMDDMANDLITVSGILETVRLKLQYAGVMEND